MILNLSKVHNYNRGMMKIPEASSQFIVSFGKCNTRDFKIIYTAVMSVNNFNSNSRCDFLARKHAHSIQIVILSLFDWCIVKNIVLIVTNINRCNSLPFKVRIPRQRLYH